jgi:hypothetical protein
MSHHIPGSAEGSFDAVVSKVTEQLAARRYSVFTDIDAQATLTAKLRAHTALEVRRLLTEAINGVEG